MKEAKRERRKNKAIQFKKFFFSVQKRRNFVKVQS